MTVSEFDASTSSPRQGGSIPSSAEFHASIADVTDDQHQNTPGLVQADDFNAEVVVRFLRENGIDARVDGSGGFFYTAADAERASEVRFACVCLRASISYALEAAFWCVKAKR
jgi:hypothetical protein